jgi:hypothetical protein
MSLAALSLLAANLPEITDEPTPAIYPVATLALDFAIPPSFAGIGGIDPLPLDRPCSPVGDANGITFDEVGRLLEVPGDRDNLQGVDNLVLLPDDSLFDLFRADDNETFQTDSIPPWSAAVGTSIRLSTLPPGGKISKKRRCGMVLRLPFMLFRTAGLIAVKEADTTSRRW